MIDLKAKLHDRYSVEFKMGFVADEKMHTGDFTVGMWFFIPGSLDITSNSFSKNEFYQCVKSNVRLITPHFKLSEVVGGEALPLKNVINSPEGEYEVRLKLFCSIVKSSLRDSLTEVEKSSVENKAALVEKYIESVRDILKEFLALKETTMKNYCGEYLCTTVSSFLFKLLKHGCCEDDIKSLIRELDQIRSSRGYPVVTVDDTVTNRDFIHRHGVLKKVVDSELFLRAPKKKDGVLVEQAYYSLAAGMAMIFATVVAWAFQRHFGNLTWPLFLALIISYMMKDRIKELMRYYFAHRISNSYYDHKAKMSVHKKEIGWIKEAMDFISSKNIPDDINRHRNKTHLFDAEDEYNKENVLLYRKRVNLDMNTLKENMVYDFEGIHDIVRIQFRPFLRQMDNPLQKVRILDEDGNPMSVKCEKDYFINVILQYQSGESTEFKRFRITLDSERVKDIVEVR